MRRRRFLVARYDCDSRPGARFCTELIALPAIDSIFYQQRTNFAKYTFAPQTRGKPPDDELLAVRGIN